LYQAGSRWDPQWVFNFLRVLKEHFTSLMTWYLP
jgi:hypothetical protein